MLKTITFTSSLYLTEIVRSNLCMQRVENWFLWNETSRLILTTNYSIYKTGSNQLQKKRDLVLYAEVAEC